LSVAQPKLRPYSFRLRKAAQCLFYAGIFIDEMKTLLWTRLGGDSKAVVFLLLVSPFAAFATDWPQYRGPTTDGVSPDPITWPAGGPTAGWTNMSLKNGFSSFAVSRGRAFTLISQDPGGGRLEYCVAVDAATGTNIWTAPIGDAPWDPGVVGVNGGYGTAPYNKGDGPRSTPSVEGGSVFVLSAHMVLVSLNWTNGAINWTKDLVALYGASEPGGGWNYSWNNAASPRLDNGLIFINLNNTVTDNNPLCAFSTTDGSRVWASPNNETLGLAHNTPVVATIQGGARAFLRP
jgi:outer membrane protein assembly factor BamB